MKRLFASLFMLTFVAGCAAFSTTGQQIQSVCTGITSTVQVLTLNQHKLTPGGKVAVVRALDLAYPVCGQGEVPTADKVKLAALQAAQIELAKLADEVRK